MGYVDLNFLNPILFQYAPYIIDANEEWGRGIYVGIYLFIYFDIREDLEIAGRM